jgi:uncharacterized membrane protein YagU involved in acid resistance
MKLARKTGVAHELDSSARSAATMVSHFGYGAAAGAVYAALLEPRANPLPKGLLFGLIVWVASYVGWLPAAGILRPASEHPPRRNLLMIAAHLIWGVALSLFVGLLAEESEAGMQQPFSAPNLRHADVA